MANTLEVFSPISGTIIPLSQVPDPVFSEKMLGDGAAVDPSEATVYAPFDGKVANLNKNLHAITVSDGTVEMLIHIGLETVQLKGQGFKTLVKEGDAIKKGQKLIEFDKDFVAKNAPSTWVMCVLTAPMDTPVTPAQGQVHAGERLFTVGTVGISSAETAVAGKVFRSEEIVITNPNGLHARPAGVLAQAAKKFPFQILICKGDKSSDAKSVVGIMGLALNFQDRVVLSVRGEDETAANQALKTIGDLIRSGLGEKGAAAQSAPVAQAAPVVATVSVKPGVPVKGLTACNGLAEGKTFLFKHEEVTFKETGGSAEEEKMLFEDCLLVLCEQMKQEVEHASNKSARGIARAHLEMLQDPFLSDETLRTIAQGKSAAYSFNEAVRKSIDLLRQTGSTFLAERIADFKDLRRRMILMLNGQTDTSYQFSPQTILLAEDLLPSDIAHFNEHVCGVALTAGSPTAHVSILLRNKNIPTLVGSGADFTSVPNGTPAFVDGTEGLLYVQPNAQEQQALHARCARLHAEEKANRENRFLPAITKDGTTVEIGGNINSEEDAKEAFQCGADSLGLVRTEFLFLQELEAPTDEKQHAQYQAIVSAMEGKPVTLRTLDIGGDKPVRYISIPAEQNPMLGLRGVRIYDDNITLFRSQVRAMLQVKPARQVRIMLPMVGFPGEMKHFRQIIEEEKQKLNLTEPVQIGMMVEIPAAALMSAQFAKEADFFSIGTNDLTQYALAIDRGHKMLSAQADGLSPALLQLIGKTCAGAAKYNRPVAVCGALAGDILAVPLLIGLGVRELAVGSGAIAQIKALVRNLSLSQCKQAAAKAMELDDAKQVREFVRKTFGL